MPISAYLKSHKFDDETVRLMGLAFEMALAASGMTALTHFVRRSRERSSSLGKSASATQSVCVTTP
jgi:hypothetical protein